MIDDDRFIIHTLNNWTFGTDDTGNIMNWNNVKDLIERMGGHDVGLVMNQTFSFLIKIFVMLILLFRSQPTVRSLVFLARLLIVIKSLIVVMTYLFALN